MKKHMHIAVGIWLLVVSSGSLAANPEPVIFGTVTPASGQAVTGTIRWGDQEQFLSDIFNGYKLTPVGIENMSADEKEQLLDHQPGPQAQIGGFQITFKSLFGKELEAPYFNVFFGSIKKIDVANDIIIATLHDGTQIISNDGSNDLSDEIYVKTLEGETKEFDLEDLKLIEFSKAPEDAKQFAEGIYGTVTSSIGTFQGRVMWDKDERTIDKALDGSDEAKEHAIKFADIVSIEKSESGDAALVGLRDQQSLLLRGTNDVNNGNRGIWIDHPDLGRVEVDWSQFEKLVIEDLDVAWQDFDDYRQLSKKLSGTVQLIDGTSIRADSLVYDMNQQSSAELLFADIEGNNRQVPLAKFKSLTRLNQQSIELLSHDDKKLVAYNDRSVTQDNNGILVTTGEQHKYYPWAQIQAITFD